MPFFCAGRLCWPLPWIVPCGTARSLPVCGPHPARMLSKILSLSCRVGREVIQPGYPKVKGDRSNTAYPLEIYWSGRGDLNTRHPAPKAGALPVCATPRRRPHWLLQLPAHGKKARRPQGRPRPAMAAPQASQAPPCVCDAASPMPARARTTAPQDGHSVALCRSSCTLPT